MERTAIFPLEPSVEVAYKAHAFYTPECGTVRLEGYEVGIVLPMAKDERVLSSRDRRLAQVASPFPSSATSHV
jgi:dTDP-4-dehydrorhamnose 3,5-epimerase-like enzyme